MPFDKPHGGRLSEIPAKTWNAWKDDYIYRIESHPNGIKGYNLNYDLKAIFFNKSTIEALINDPEINMQKDFVVFRFISKTDSHLNITPCVMEEGSYEIKKASNMVGHLHRGEKDVSFSEKDFSLSLYENRLNDLKNEYDFEGEGKGIVHRVVEFERWFQKNPKMNEFTVIMLYDAPLLSQSTVLGKERKTNLGFINSASLPMDKVGSVQLNKFIGISLYDQGSSCCPPLKRR